MKLHSLYEAAVAGVCTSHLDALLAAGASRETIANLGADSPPFGVMAGEIERDGRFNPGEGIAHVLQPIYDQGELVDLVAWRPGNPRRWGMVAGLGWMLNADEAFASRLDGWHLSLHATPLAFLGGDGTGAVVLDWSSPEVDWLRTFERVDCSDELVAAALRRALNKPRRCPAIRVVAGAVRNAA